MLAEAASRLAGAGAELIAIPCNTAHAFLDVVRDAAPGVLVMDMIAATVEAIAPYREGAAVGLLATDGTITSGLYQHALTARGLTPLVPELSHQRELMTAIRRVKARGVDHVGQAIIRSQLDRLRDAGARCVIAGCTEVPLLCHGNQPVPVVDATATLASAVVREARGVDATSFHR